MDVPKAGGPTDFSVSTPVATLSIRGTAGQIGYCGDSGMQLESFRGIWNLNNNDNLGLNIGPGENTNGLFTPYFQLLAYQWLVFPGDFFGGTTPSEWFFVQTVGSGRGVILLTTTTTTNDLTNPTVTNDTLPQGTITVPGGIITIGGSTGGSMTFSVKKH